MASFRPLCLLLICLFSAFVLASAQPSVTHYHGGSWGGSGYRGSGRDPPIGSLSKFNPDTKSYEPVTSDGSYTYYRLAIVFKDIFTDSFVPDPTKPTLIQRVISGDVYDNTTGALAGTFDSSSITTVLTAENQVQILSALALELGPEGDDTVFLQASTEAPISSGPVVQTTDYDVAITGGTGRYKGATGEVQQFGSRSGVAEVAVPRFRRF